MTTADKSVTIMDNDIGVRILEKRYLLKDTFGNPREHISDLFHRVASTLAHVERKYGASEEDVVSQHETFFDVMWDGRFMPNSPTLTGAGRSGMLSACFVLPVPDSIEGVFKAIGDAAKIHQTGGGTGFSFSNIRPEGDIVHSSGGVASGPLSFLRVFNEATNAIKQGGTRRGANMAIMSVYHPDILKFITSKRDLKELTNFNISVAIDAYFMERVQSDGWFFLVNPRNEEVWRAKEDLMHPLTGELLVAKGDLAYLSARMVFDIIVECAHGSGEPGLFFVEEANKYNPTPTLGSYTATNPCGEQPLLENDVCNLGSINLDKFHKDGYILWDELKTTIRTAVRMLDNVIDANVYPLQAIHDVSHRIRRIGLGIMGWADMLIGLGVPYNSNTALSLATRIMMFIDQEAKDASEDLARERGVFPEWKESIWGPDATCAKDESGKRIRSEKRLRNCNITTVAPTGTISMIAGCSSGIEPLFAVAFWRYQADMKMLDVNKKFVALAQTEGWYSEELMARIADSGHIHHPEVPEQYQKLFATAHDITPEWHISMQAAFQQFVDSAISKTINFPHDATTDDVRSAYLLAYELKCKGVTVYRDGSRGGQVLSTGATAQQPAQQTTEDSVKSDQCPQCPGVLVKAEGCSKCMSCAYSVCDAIFV